MNPYLKEFAAVGHTDEGIVRTGLTVATGVCGINPAACTSTTSTTGKWVTYYEYRIAYKCGALLVLRP